MTRSRPGDPENGKGKGGVASPRLGTSPRPFLIFVFPFLSWSETPWKRIQHHGLGSATNITTSVCEEHFDAGATEAESKQAESEGNKGMRWVQKVRNFI